MKCNKLEEHCLRQSKDKEVADGLYKEIRTELRNSKFIEFFMTYLENTLVENAFPTKSYGEDRAKCDGKAFIASEMLTMLQNLRS